MIDNAFLNDYFARYSRASFGIDFRSQLLAFREFCLEAKQRKGKLMFACNGASAFDADNSSSVYNRMSF